MKEAQQQLGAELFQGAIYGLGISAAVWIPLNTGTLESLPMVGICTLAALCGASSWRPLGYQPLALPFIAAGFVLFGMPAAILIAVGSALISGFLPASRRSSGALAFDVGSYSLATIAASSLTSLAMAKPIIFSAPLFCTTWLFSIGLISWAQSNLQRRDRDSEVHRLKLFGILALTSLYAAAIVLVWRQPQGMLIAGTLAALRLGWLTRSVVMEWLVRRVGRVALSEDDRLQRRLAEAIASRDDLFSSHLWRVQALAAAMGERLGTTPAESQALSQAALLHHAGQLTLDDAAIEVHPSLLDETVSRLGFSEDVRLILRDSFEYWDGRGPQALEGETIDRCARILSVADRYDRIAHNALPRRSHRSTMTRLRREVDQRLDPLMLELLEELSESLEQSGADLSKPRPQAERSQTAGGLLQADAELKTLYDIERIATLPLAARERWTLAAGRLRGALTLRSLTLQVGEQRWRYGDRDDGTQLQTIALEHQGIGIGSVRLTCDERPTSPDSGWLQRIADALATIAHDVPAEAPSGGWTDAVTGLPNGDYLERLLKQRLPGEGEVTMGLGLIAFQLEQTLPDEDLIPFARQLAAGCTDEETLVRFGPRQFVALTRVSRSGDLVARWHQIAEQVEPRFKMNAAHATHPIDGEQAEQLYRTLDERLLAATQSKVLAFPKRRAAG